MEATIWNLVDLIDLKAGMVEMEVHQNWEKVVDQIQERRFLGASQLYPTSEQVIRESKKIQYIKLWNNLLTLILTIIPFSR